MKRYYRAFYTIGLVVLAGGFGSAACGSDEGGDSAAGGATSVGGVGAAVGGAGAMVGGAATASGGRVVIGSAGGAAAAGGASAAAACEGGNINGDACDPATDTVCSMTFGGPGGMQGGMTCTCTNNEWDCVPTLTGAGGAMGAGGATGTSTGTSAGTTCAQNVRNNQTCDAATATDCTRMSGAGVLQNCTCATTGNASAWQCTSATTGAGGNTFTFTFNTGG